MSAIVVTVPKTFRHPCAPGMVGLAAWLREGDAAGEPWSGTLWEFSTWGHKPNIVAGERVYIVCEDRLRGYAPLVDLEFEPTFGGNGMGRYVSFAAAVPLRSPSRRRSSGSEAGDMCSGTKSKSTHLSTGEFE